ncbi:hypothetical protein AALB39_28275 [Lachnospiraceae bacterium 54-53]
MVIIKHIASKNADHRTTENTRLSSIMNLQTSPYWMRTAECKKNLTKNEIESHHYIFSFDPSDRVENRLNAEKALDVEWQGFIETPCDCPTVNASGPNIYFIYT